MTQVMLDVLDGPRRYVRLLARVVGAQVVADTTPGEVDGVVGMPVTSADHGLDVVVLSTRPGVRRLVLEDPGGRVMATGGTLAAGVERSVGAQHVLLRVPAGLLGHGLWRVCGADDDDVVVALARSSLRLYVRTERSPGRGVRALAARVDAPAGTTVRLGASVLRGRSWEPAAMLAHGGGHVAVLSVDATRARVRATGRTPSGEAFAREQVVEVAYDRGAPLDDVPALSLATLRELGDQLGPLG